MDELFTAAKNGSSKAFMTIVEAITEQMYKTALVQLKNEQDALDAMQEALIKAFSNIKQLNHNKFFKSWLIRILLNECHNIQKYKSKVIPMDRALLEKEETVEPDSFETVELYHLVSQLDDIYIEIIDLRYNYDMKLEEISKVLEIPIGTVKSRINTAHKLLRNQYLKKEASL